jgi:Ni,Fe-hydrogenase III small subunit
VYTLLRDLQRLRRRAALERPRAGSLALRHVDAGSCNGCEHELTAAGGPFADIQRFGLDIVASPRHADALVVTGPVTTRMLEPLRAAYAAMPEPRLVVAVGDCALGCGLLARGEEIVGPVDEVLPVAVRIPGCPPAPPALVAGLRQALAVAEAVRRSKAAKPVI